MKDLPHQYAAIASGVSDGDIALGSPRLPTLPSAAPEEFGGPGDRWSPETLLVAALADCYVLTFRALARRSNLEWSVLACEVEGTVDRVDRVIRFTAFMLRVRLRLASGAGVETARRLLEKAEHGCLISNSLVAPIRLETAIELEASASVCAE